MSARMIVVALLAAACSNAGPGTRVVNDTDEVDLTPPVIVHTHDPAPRTFGDPVYIDADVTDDSDILDVFLVFQQETDGNAWKPLRMVALTDVLYEGVIPASDITSGGVRYFLRAVDEWDNSVCLPEACEAEAWHFPVVPPRD